MKSLDAIVADLLATESLAARSRWLILAAIGIWLAASAAALIMGDGGQFARAGALGTGFVLAAFAVNASARQSYQSHLLKGLVLILRSNLRDRHGRPLMLPNARPEDPDTAIHDFDHNLEAVARLFSRLNSRSGHARAAEVGAAAVATLQWGYGDLLFNQTLGCGAWSC